MSEPSNAETGLLASVKKILHALQSFVESRIELFLVELQEERVRVVEVLLLAICGVFCSVMALLLITFTLVVIFWEDHRGLVLALLIVAYGGCAFAAILAIRRRLLNWQAFSATLAQLKKDRECFTPKEN